MRLYHCPNPPALPICVHTQAQTLPSHPCSLRDHPQCTHSSTAQPQGLQSPVPTQAHSLASRRSSVILDESMHGMPGSEGMLQFSVSEDLTSRQ